MTHINNKNCMSTENLSNADAVKKIKELAKNGAVCHFVTNLKSAPLDTRPMATKDVDDEGTIWFISKNDSKKNLDIAKDDTVQLFYANDSYEYLSVYGEAEIHNEKALIEKYWSSIDKAWFPEGKDDPTITLISVKPTDAYYWDTKNNKLVSLIKIAVAAVTGKPNDDGGVQGKLKV